MNEGEERDWSRTEGRDVDGGRQQILLDICNSLRRVVNGTGEGRNKRIGGQRLLLLT